MATVRGDICDGDGDRIATLGRAFNTAWRWHCMIKYLHVNRLEAVHDPWVELVHDLQSEELRSAAQGVTWVSSFFQNSLANSWLIVME